MKICKRCGIEKDFNSFYLVGKYYKSYCKACDSLYYRERKKGIINKENK